MHETCFFGKKNNPKIKFLPTYLQFVRIFTGNKQFLYLGLLSLTYMYEESCQMLA